MGLSQADLSRLPEPVVVTGWELLPVLADISHRPKGLHLPNSTRGIAVEKRPALLFVPIRQFDPSGPPELAAAPTMLLFGIDDRGNPTTELFADAVRDAGRATGKMWREFRASLPAAAEGEQ